MKRLIYLLPFLTFAQSDVVWHDLTNSLTDKARGWGIGNACGVDSKLYGIYQGDLDMEGGDLQILNSHFIIEGNIINQGTITYLCDDAVLEIKGEVLNVEKPIKETFKVYPNPSVNEINIKGIEVSSLELYDMTGRKLKDFRTFGSLHRIMIDDLKSGIYILRINEKLTHQIIKI